MNPESSVFVAGHEGLVGSAIVRELERRGAHDIITRTRGDLDLRDAEAVADFFAEGRPEYVYLAAARVGGIVANDSHPVEFLQDNLAIQSNVMASAHQSGARKLMFLGSSCVYPRAAPQPMREESLLTGPLEPTNEGYALAKIVGLKLASYYRRQYDRDFVSVMPSNAYGPGDNFHPKNSHVVPGMIRRFHEAKGRGDRSVAVWGSGTPRRELLYVDDLADACVHLMAEWSDDGFVNIGTGQDITIADLARLIGDVVGFEGEIEFDRSKPDGMPRKVLDVTRLTAAGWASRTSLREGLERTYAWFLASEHPHTISS